jgi:TetR/AcrR family transcriptional repressor of uid operon
MRTLDPIKHEERKRQILEAAGRCFARSGFQGASISDICAEAKISSGHLYHYFDSKEAIVSVMSEVRLELAVERFRRLMEDSDPVAAFVKGLEQTRSNILILDMLAEARHNKAMAQIVTKNSRELRVLVARFIENGQQKGKIDKGLDPEMAAAVLLSIIDGAKTIAVRDPKLDRTATLKHLKIMVTRFLKPA